MTFLTDITVSIKRRLWMTKQKLLNQIDETYKKNKAYKNPLLSEYTIKALHRLCCHSESAGTYRDKEALPLGKGHIPPAPEEIDHFMHHFMNQMETSHIMFHPVEFTAIAYKRLLDICPFETHNEETATLFLNLLLAQEGYPVIHSPSTLDGYEQAMEKARIMPFPDTNPLTVLVAKELLNR